MTTLSGLFIVFCSCISLFDGTSLEDHACVGMRRGEEYDFFLPDHVANVYIDSCDAEWSVDQYTAILDGKTINFSHPFKNVTTYGISVNYCPVSVKYHVSCQVSTRSLTCSCTNSTNIKQSVPRTTLPSTVYVKRLSLKEEGEYQLYLDLLAPPNHNLYTMEFWIQEKSLCCFCCVCCLFWLHMLILIFIWRTKRGSAAGHNQPDSSV